MIKGLIAVVIFVLILISYFGLNWIFADEALGCGGTCCDQAGATCYIVCDGVVIVQRGAYYSPSSCQPQ